VYDWEEKRRDQRGFGHGKDSTSMASAAATIQWIGLREKNIYRNPLYFMVKTMVSCM
jgi:type IV secretory pathway TrbF-like protein